MTCACVFLGGLYQDILDILSSKANGLSEKLLVYYSAHDSTLVTLRAALGMSGTTLDELVKTGSAMILELHNGSNSTEFSVEVHSASFCR